MKKRTSIAIFLAASSALAITTTDSNTVKAEKNDLGGLKEWNTDMPIEAEYILDENAQKLAEESKKLNLCVPIGEGENCW